MRVKVYQIDCKRDVHHVKFQDLDNTAKFQSHAAVDPALYDEVFNAELDITDVEEVYRRFNTEGHPLYRGHSLSVSDVVVMNDRAYFCQPVGFQEVSFDESLTHKPENMLTVVYVEPHKAPYVAEIQNTLVAEQKAVGGLIELIGNGDGTFIVCNDEGKLIGMEGNRRIRGGTSIIAGPFFVVGDGGEDFRSLTEQEAERYMQRFAEIEDISMEDVQADTGFVFFCGM